jgi:DNA helicase IV
MYKNFRNSKEILEFTRSVFPNILIPQESINQAKQTGLKPIMKITGWSDDSELESIMSIINDFQGDTHNIGILVHSQKDVTKYFDRIKDKLSAPIQCTKYQSEMADFNGLSGIHITTTKSSKGIEFDTVIIPNFDRFDYLIANNTIPITEKDYYVAFTRTKINLFLICRNNPHKGDIRTFEIE